MLTTMASLRSVLYALAMGASMIVSVNAEPAPTIYLAQLLTPAQNACATVCNKRCDTDYHACSMNGKAPRLLIDNTCTPHQSACTAKCTASCYK
jgi:hypothetical protein